MAPVAGLVMAGCATASLAASGPALWQLSDEDTNIYLFGTIHLLPKGQDWRTPAIQQAIAASDELMLEVVLGDNPTASALTMMKLGTSPGLPPLAERVPEEKRAALNAMVASAGVPAQALDGMETWAAALMLTAVNYQRMGLDPALGVESGLTGTYQSAKKPILGLETPEEQFGFFDQLPEDAQRAMLVTVLDDPEDARAQFATMVAAWASGDVDAIAQSFNEDVSLSPLLRERLLKQRNERWAEQLAHRLDRPGTVFVAVGAGHLAGPESVQTMLAARGHKVRRLQ